MSRIGNGASAMDAYEVSYKQLEYDYDKSADLPLRTLIFRKALYVIQMVMVCGAGIMLAGAVIAQKDGIRYSSLPFGSMETELVLVPMACAFVSMITAFVGCVGARSRSKIALVLYMLFIGSAFALAIAATAQAYADSSNVELYAKRQWNKMTILQTQTFQRDNKCCNFNTKGPCCRFAAGSGECANHFTCFQIVEDSLTSNFALIGTTSLLQCIYLFGVAVCALVLYKIVEGNPSLLKTKSTNTKSTNTKSSKKSERGGKEGFSFPKDDPDYFT